MYVPRGMKRILGYIISNYFSNYFQHITSTSVLIFQTKGYSSLTAKLHSLVLLGRSLCQLLSLRALPVPHVVLLALLKTPHLLSLKILMDSICHRWEHAFLPTQNWTAFFQQVMVLFYVNIKTIKTKSCYVADTSDWLKGNKFSIENLFDMSTLLFSYF